MPIESPVLDDLRYDRMVEEMIRRIPVYAPEWTDFNDSDPGISLIQLFAFLAEQVVYRLNRLPEKNHVELLKLLGIRLTPARAARTSIAFFLSDPAHLVGFRIDASSRAMSPGTPAAIFETDRALDVIPAQPVVILATKNPFLWDLLRLNDGGAREPQPSDADLPSTLPASDSAWLTLAWDGKKPKAQDMPVAPIPVDPPSSSGVLHPYVWIGLDFNDARDAGFLGVKVTLHVQFDDDEQPDPSKVELCAPIAVPGEPAPPPVEWLAYYDADAAAMKLIPGRIEDTTAQLTRSGTLRFSVPFTFGAIPPGSYANLRDAITPTPVDACAAVASNLAGALTVPSGGGPISFNVASFQGALTNAVNAATAATAATKPAVPHPLDPKFRDPTKVRGWLRIRLQDPQTQRKLRFVGFNATPATNAVTVTGELLGRADGRPGQQFRLAHENVDAESLELAIAESAAPGALLTTWQPIETLEAAGPFDRVYELDAEAGTIAFGDGQHGRIPPLVPSAGTVVAMRYRYGGGVSGERPTGGITVSGVQVAGLGGVVNFVAATGGHDPESLAHAKLRARKLLSSRTRAVTRADFEWFARATPEVRVARAIIVPRRRPLPPPATPSELAGLKKQAAAALAQAAEKCRPPGAPIVAPGGKTPVLLAAGVAPCGPPLPAPPAGLDAVFDAPGIVTVVVVPDQPGFEPLPTPSFLRAVCVQLDRYRLITTEIYVVPPQYFRLCNVTLRVKGKPGYTRSQLQELALGTLSTYLDVLRGGPDGKGAPFGAQVHIADLIAQVFHTEGVERVESLSADFVRTKSDAEPRAGKLVLCPTAVDEFDHVDLASEETTSLESSSFALSTV